MAKFEDYLQSSDLTWSNLSDATNKKIDAYENTYKAYSNAYDAQDQALTSKYEKQLDTLDAEVVALMKKDEAAAKPAPKTETPLEKVASENTTPQTKPEQKEVKAETKVEEVKSEETKPEQPKEEGKKGSGFYIGMFEV